jgi:hypothetical protein
MKRAKEQKIERFIKKQLDNKKVNQVMMLLNPQGRYILFGKYIIDRQGEVYQVSIENNDREFTFSSLKTAITWCSFNYRRKIPECKQIEAIDRKLLSLEVDVIQQTNILNNSKDDDKRLIYVTKIEEQLIKKKILTTQLNNFINLSKEWQLQNFNLEKQSIKR